MAYIDPDKAKPAKTCDAAADMKVSSIKSDNLIVTILATSNCDDKNASTKFNDSATRLTLQDSDDNVVADAVFDFRVYSTYTAQLSSKRKGMEAEGKTWNYRDILAQFITMHGDADGKLDAGASGLESACFRWRIGAGPLTCISRRA